MEGLGRIWKQPKPKKRYHKRFDRIHFYSRWSHKYPPDDWTIIGIAKWWFGPEDYSYRICFFGLELRIWIKREFR